MQTQNSIWRHKGFKKIPKRTEYDEIMRRAHGNMHLGLNAVENELFKHYWFPNMRIYIKNYLEECPICLLKKPTVKKRRPPSIVMYEEYPLDRV